MPENHLEFNFRSDKKLKLNKKLEKSIHSKLKISDSDIISQGFSSKKSKSSYLNFITYVGDVPFDSDKLEDSLLLIEDEVSGYDAYIHYYLEQTNDSFFYSLNDKRLLSFKTQKECIEFSDKSTEISPEVIFYDFCDGSKSNLLIRLSFYKKKDIKSFYDALEAIRNEKSDDSIEALSRLIFDDECKFNIGFNEYVRECDIQELWDLFKCIEFVHVKDKHLYIGYQFSADKYIEPVAIEDAALLGPEENIENETGLNITKLVEIYTASRLVNDKQAKFISPKLGCNGIFYVLYDLTYQPFWEKPKLPAIYWY